MKKLVNEVGTTYVASHFSKDVEEILEKEDGIDIAEAACGPDVASILKTYQQLDKCIIDSTNNERDKIFRVNEKVIAERRGISESDMIMLPVKKKDEDVIEYIKNLNADKVYTDNYHETFIPTVALINSTRYKIRIEILTKLREYFEFVNNIVLVNEKDLSDMLKITNEFHILYDTSYYTIEVPKDSIDTEFYSLVTGRTTLSKLYKSSMLPIPSFIGSRVAKEGEPEFKYISRLRLECLKVLDNNINRPSLFDFLKSTNE